MADTHEQLRHLPVTTDSAEARRHFEVGRMMAFQYQQGRARRSLDAAIAADPGFVLAYLHRGGMSNNDERGPYFEQARAHRDRVTADEGRMIDAFHAFLWDQRVADAVAIFTELADRYPDDPYLPTYLGLRYLHNLGRPDRAREQFERALRRDPAFAPGYLWLGQVALREGDLDEAGTSNSLPRSPEPTTASGSCASDRAGTRRRRRASPRRWTSHPTSPRAASTWPGSPSNDRYGGSRGRSQTATAPPSKTPTRLRPECRFRAARPSQGPKPCPDTGPGHR
jgi:Tfp pilus assembly protein PilF